MSHEELQERIDLLDQEEKRMIEMMKSIKEGNGGEYLGDIEITHETLSHLSNINSYYNRIHGVPRGRYMMCGFFDLKDGHFLGLILTFEGEAPELVEPGGLTVAAQPDNKKT